MLPESVGVLMQMVRIFDNMHIPYMVGGSLASALYGVARSTLDADFVVEMRSEQVDRFVEALGKDYYTDGDMIHDAIHHHSSFNLIHLKSMFKIDVFIRKERPYDREEFERRVEQVLTTDPEQKAFFSTPEDMILAKLEWYRLGSEVSDRQWQDVLGILKVQANRLDYIYLGKWSKELNIADLLQRALKDSE